MTEYKRLLKGAAIAQRARHRAVHTGKVAGRRVWTPAETAKFKRLHPDYAALKKAFPYRTRVALRHYAAKLDLERRRCRPWTHREIKILRALYAKASIQELEAALPGRYRRAIWDKAQWAGLRKLKRYKSTGNSLLDQIRRRAASRNVIMKELDHECGRRQEFFQSMTPKQTRNFRCICKAVEYLDGEITIVWHD